MMSPKYFTTALVATVALSFLGADEIKGRGSMFPAPLYKVWGEAYYAVTKSSVRYIPTDSLDGIRSISRGMADFSAVDTPLDPSVLEKKRLLVFPSVLDAVVLAYNIKGVKDGALKLSRSAILGIFNGSIAFWDDPEITKVNQGLTLPHAPITVVVDAQRSTTTLNFTSFLNRLDSTIKASKKPRWKAKRVIAGRANAGVSLTVKQTENTLGYVDYLFKKRFGLSTAQIENREGNFINPTPLAFQEAFKNASPKGIDGGTKRIDDPMGETAYPIISASYVLLSKEQVESNKKVVDFMNWAYTHGDNSATNLGYVPLPQATKEAIRNYWKSIPQSK